MPSSLATAHSENPRRMPEIIVPPRSSATSPARRVGIHLDLVEHQVLGGAEFCVAALAEALEGVHDVDIIHNNTRLDRRNVAETFGIDLQQTRFRMELPDPPGRARMPWSVYREAMAAAKHITQDYDVLISIGHHVPPFCHARLGLLLVLFPAGPRSDFWPWSESRDRRRASLYRAVRDRVHDRIWRDRFDTYAVKISISSFARRWTQRWWQLDTEVVYPPVDVPRPVDGPREPLILNVGRITPVKKQLEMVRAFGAMAGRVAPGWSFCCAGGLTSKANDLEYFGQLERAGGGAAVSLLTNPSRDRLEGLLSRASIYWHAMGYGADDDPFCMEHFGISTVEAMGAGCVPVVIKRGAQPEIVRHGVDGFLWETIEELDHYTALLIRDAELRRTLAESARQQALRFHKRHFVEQIASRCGLATPSISGR